MTGIEVQVWDSANTTMLGVLTRRWDVQWQDALNQAGVGSVTVHKDDPLAADASNLAMFNIVRFVYQGATRFAFRIENRRRALVDSDASGQAWELSGRGVLALLADAALYPEYGLTRLSGTDRYFTWASAEGEWYDAADWSTPTGIRQDATTSPRRVGTPEAWPDPAAQWLWSTNPESDVVDGTTNWFRGTFSLDSATDVRIYVTGDDYFRVFLDGEIIVTSLDDVSAWRDFSTHDVEQLASGDHIVAIECKNRVAPGDNPAAVLLTMAEVDSRGNPSATLFRSDTNNWLVATTLTGWQPHHILRTIVTEAQSRSVDAANNITLGFSATTDSDGAAWVTSITERSFRVGEDCLSIATTLAEDSDMDIWLDPATMTLEAYQGIGSDLSTGSTPIVMRPALSITEMELNETRAAGTRIIALTENGWYEQADATQESALGRIETWAALGGAYTAAEAQRQANGLLAYFAYTAADASVETTDANGPAPYVDYSPGDTVLAPDSFTKGSFAAYKVMSLNVTEAADGTVRCTVELDGNT